MPKKLKFTFMPFPYPVPFSLSLPLYITHAFVTSKTAFHKYIIYLFIPSVNGKHHLFNIVYCLSISVSYIKNSLFIS